MTNIHQLQNDTEVRAAAAAWRVRLDSDIASEADRIQFEEWRSAHPRNARAYDEIVDAWEKLSNLGKGVKTFERHHTLSVSAHRAVRRARAAGRRRRWSFTGFAATLVVILCVGWWARLDKPDTLFRTAIGERATVQLPDGSSLELNSNSLARVAYSAEKRVIRLERGEAYFKVKHDARRPFWVAAGESWVAAVGTAFSVDLRASGMKVTVSEGVVKVAAEYVKAGEQVSLSDSVTEVRSLAPVQLRRSLAWREGAVDFKKDPLAEVVEELNRYTPVRMVIKDNSLRGLPIGGTFQTNASGAEALLMTLQDGFGLRVRQDGGTAYISER